MLALVHLTRAQASRVQTKPVATVLKNAAVAAPSNRKKAHYKIYKASKRKLGAFFFSIARNLLFE